MALCVTTAVMCPSHHPSSCNAGYTRMFHRVWKAASSTECQHECSSPSPPDSPSQLDVSAYPVWTAFWPARWASSIVRTTDPSPLLPLRSTQWSATSHWPRTRYVLGVHVCSATNMSLCESTGVPWAYFTLYMLLDMYNRLTISSPDCTLHTAITLMITVVEWWNHTYSIQQ